MIDVNVADMAEARPTVVLPEEAGADLLAEDPTGLQLRSSPFLSSQLPREAYLCVHVSRRTFIGP